MDDLGGVLFELVPNPAGEALPGNSNAHLSLAMSDIRQVARELQAQSAGQTF